MYDYCKSTQNYMTRAFPPSMIAQLRINSESFGSSAWRSSCGHPVQQKISSRPLQKAACTGDASATGHSWAWGC